MLGFICDIIGFSHSYSYLTWDRFRLALNSQWSQESPRTPDPLVSTSKALRLEVCAQPL